MEESSNVVAEPKPQSEAGAPESQSPPDSESLYQRRAAFLSNPRARLGFILAGLVILIAIFFLWRYLASYESTDDAEVDGHVNSVSARVSGHVLKLNVEDNQYVEKGTVLVEIDPADYEVAVAQARAVYADAQAQAAAAGINVPITSVSTSSLVSGAPVRRLESRLPASSLKQPNLRSLKRKPTIPKRRAILCATNN
jgi:membrane fusion protein (multidrug efflux system)